MRYLMAAVLIIVAAGTLARAAGQQRIGSRPQVEPGKVRVQPPDLPKPKGLAVTVETYPRTGGSTSAEPLGVWVACRLLGKECWWPGTGWRERRLWPLVSGADKARPPHERRDQAFYQKIPQLLPNSVRNLVHLDGGKRRDITAPGLSVKRPKSTSRQRRRRAQQQPDPHKAPQIRNGPH